MIKLVSLKDIIDNEYNLNIPRYIPKQEEEENFVLSSDTHGAKI